MNTRTLSLFLFTYEDGEEHIKQRPIYALASKLAVDEALDWLIEHKDCTYQSVEAASEGTTINGTFYAARKVVPVDGLLLYVHEFFLRHAVHRRPIYAANEKDAIEDMNVYYGKLGLGNYHKTLNRSVDGIIIDGIYYAPSAI